MSALRNDALPHDRISATWTAHPLPQAVLTCLLDMERSRKVSVLVFVNSVLKGQSMKRVSLLVLVGMLLIAGTVWARNIRVKFPPGRTTVVLKGRTTGGPSESGGMNPITYLLRARKGQTMTLHLTSARKNAVFGVWAPGVDLVEGAQDVKDWTGQLPKTGDYQISVWPDDEKTNTTFTLEITVR